MRAIARWLRIRVARARAYALRKLLRNRFAMALLRRFSPLQRITGRVWVTRYEDAVDVLRRDRDFGVPYLDKMCHLEAPFILGLPDIADYRQQLELLRRAIVAADLPDIARWSALEADRRVACARGGRIDVIAGLADPVVAATTSRYLGLGELTEKHLCQARAVFEEIFINSLGNPEITERAERAAKELRAHVRHAVDARRAAVDQGGEDRHDVVGRLLHIGDAGESLEDDVLVNNVMGLFVAWAAQVPRSLGFALDLLLSRAVELGRIHSAARAGDHGLVKALLLESLRLQPSVPALERTCMRESRLGSKTMKRGTDVLVVLTSAMMDERGVAQPRAFRSDDRPLGDHLYFGRDLHVCLGRDIAQVQNTAIAGALLQRGDLRRAGRLRYEGPYPRHLKVRFGATSGR